MFFVSLLLFIGACIAIGVYGLNFGVDFKGGSLMEIEFSQTRPSVTELNKFFEGKIIDVSVNQTGDSGVIVRSGEIDEQKHQQILAELKKAYPDMTEKRFDSVGPTVGQELRRKSIVAIVIVLIAILCYIAFAFRKLSRTLSLWGMLIGTVVALLHDIILPIGVLAILGHYAGVQISAIFVAAMLTILGYTVSDKVVIYDRVRENILRGNKDEIASVVHLSVMQTLVRSVNNTLTVMLSSAAIYFFGGESIKYFALALMIGTFSGAYSSIFVASPFVVYWEKWRKKKA